MPCILVQTSTPRCYTIPEIIMNNRMQVAIIDLTFLVDIMFGVWLNLIFMHGYLG